MGRSSLPLYAILSGIVSLICGFFQAFPLFAVMPTAGALFSAARGLAAMNRLAGYNAASPIDYFHAWLWRAGGPALLAWGKWSLVFLGWTLGAFLVLVILRAALLLFTGPRTRKIVWMAAAAILLAAGLPAAWSGFSAHGNRVSDLRLVAPVELIDQVRSMAKDSLFANASGQVHLLLFAPPLAGAISPGEAARLTNNPPKWREALRQSKWQAVLLTGPVSEYRPLLDHLITSPDWRLAALTNQGYVFLRGPGESLKSLDIETLRLSSDEETAVYLAQMAERYDAIRRSAEAQACLKQARQLAPDNASVLAHAATFAAAHQRWQDAISLSNKALAVEPDFAQARIVQALALLEIQKPERARVLIEQVIRRNPDDLYTLFLYARICRTLNDYAIEAETLEKLVALSKAAGLPVINYQIYLGQAYARMGQAKPALENYRAVLAGGQLNPDQKGEIEDAIATIESKETP